MTYWMLNTWFLAAVLLIAVLAWIVGARPRIAGMAGALAIVGLLTAVFDNAIIGFGLVAYDLDLISGVMVGVAPLEDFAYTLAGAILIPVVWELLGRAKRRSA